MFLSLLSSMIMNTLTLDMTSEFTSTVTAAKASLSQGEKLNDNLIK